MRGGFREMTLTQVCSRTRSVWYKRMTILTVLFCSLSIVYCDAAVSKKFINKNYHIHFSPYPELGMFNWPTKENEIEDAGSLTTSLLHDIYHQAGKDFNIVLSPVSVWTILAMLLEGAGGKTENELKSKLQLSYKTHEEGQRLVRDHFRKLENFYRAKNSPTQFTSLNFIISDKTRMIKAEYKNIVRGFYNGQNFEVDGKRSWEFLSMINNWASQATNNRIRGLVTPAMLNNLVMLVGNAVYLKSKWKYPFDPSDTILLPFRHEFDGPITNVPMMNQVSVLPYAFNSLLESQIVEIPYSDGLTSMVVILPREGLSLSIVLSKMKRLNLHQIIPKNMTEDIIQLSLPRFHMYNKIFLNDVLKQDLPSVFSPQNAEFPYIGENIFVSKVSHKAEIENTEEGTTASAVSSVQFAYKSLSIIFRANRPFVYLINVMKTRTILFAGTYSNPLTDLRGVPGRINREAN